MIHRILENETISLHQAQETELIPQNVSIGTKDEEQSKEIEAEQQSEHSEYDTESVTSEYEIGQEIDPAPAEVTIIRCFKSWLMSLDGSAKKDRDARLHVAQLSFISKSINGNQENDNILNVIDGDLVRDHWLKNVSSNVSDRLGSFWRQAACKVQNVRNMMDNIQVTSNFFNKSPKKQTLLEEMASLCQSTST